MALRNVRKEGEEILRKKCRDVTKIDDKIKILMKDMLDTMYYAEGIGLAAPQIGILKKVIVIDIGDQKVYKMINPKIISSSGEQTDEEGCLSVPDIRGPVTRPLNVTVNYTDENGKDVTLDAEGLFARCICHEVDHLEGVLFVDKMDE